MRTAARRLRDGRDGELADFALLLEYVGGDSRHRAHPLHDVAPAEFTQRLIDVYARLPQLVKHVHLPVQSGSDRVLAHDETRLHACSNTNRSCAGCAKSRPDISISSDFIVGFPGETEADFDATMKLIEEVGFDASFSFVYSPRPGTPAAALPDDTPHEMKLARLQRLQALLDAQAARDQREHGRHDAARAGRRRLEERRARARGPHRQQSHRQLSPARPRLVGQFIDVDHFRRAAALVARQARTPCTLETRRSLVHAGRQPAARQLVRRAGREPAPDRGRARRRRSRGAASDFTLSRRRRADGARRAGAATLLCRGRDAACPSKTCSSG